jgi:hypothetical protein
MLTITASGSISLLPPARQRRFALFDPVPVLTSPSIKALFGRKRCCLTRSREETAKQNLMKSCLSGCFLAPLRGFA